MKKLLTHVALSVFTAISRLSWSTLYKISDFLRYLFFTLFHYRRRTIIGNLTNSFPNKTPEEIEQIAGKFHRNFTDIIVETIKMKTVSKSDLISRFEMKTDILDHYMAQNRSAVVVAGHLGNWEMLNLYASARLTHQIVVVYHKLANDIFNDWFTEMRTRFGAELIPMKDAFQRAVAPREKPFLYVLINDQSPHPDRAYWTTFLHQDTGVFRGAELIARRMNAPVLYMGVLRDQIKRGFYHIYFKVITESPREVPTNGILEGQMAYLEADITAQPDNWLWSHKRWKHRKPPVLKRDQLLQASE